MEPKYKTMAGKEFLDFVTQHGHQEEVWDMSPEQVDNALNKALAELDPHQREFVELRYGLKDGQTHSFDYLKKHCRVAKEKARQFEREAMGMIMQQAELTDLLQSDAREAALYSPASSLSLRPRAYWALHYAKVDLIMHLTEKTEDDLLNMRGLGKASVAEIKEELAKLGLSLRE